MRFSLIIFLLLSLSSCSAGYIIKASYKELGILLKRKDIKEVALDPNIDSDTKEKLLLVLEVRKFCKELGLIPKGSFTQYSKIDDDVLVWVISASQKHRLEAKTWWFPIVGHLPYKGFFELEDAKEERIKLEQDGFDTFLRTSDAFSTLGWFNDPLLSTVLKRDHASIVNTVIHEITHNTIWIKNNAAFNETMANALGNIGTVEFYRSKNNEEMLKKSEDSLKRELEYSKLLEDTLSKLNQVYKNQDHLSDKVEIERSKIFNQFKIELAKISSIKNIENLNINNAYFLAQATYFNKFNTFFELYEKQGRSLKNMISVLKKLDRDLNPYQALEDLH